MALDLADYAGRQLVVKGTSHVDLNGMRLLRRALGAEASGPLALGGADNVVGPTLGREARAPRAPAALPARRDGGGGGA